jgi:hypothetical protein
MGEELIVLCPAKNLPGTLEVPMAAGRPKAAFVLDLVRRTDLHRGEQLDGRCKSEPGSPEKSALGEADCRTVRTAEPLITGEGLGRNRMPGTTGCDLPRGSQEGSMLARNESQNAEPLGSRLGVVCRSEGVWYSREVGEIGILSLGVTHLGIACFWGRPTRRSRS